MYVLIAHCAFGVALGALAGWWRDWSTRHHRLDDEADWPPRLSTVAAQRDAIRRGLAVSFGVAIAIASCLYAVARFVWPDSWLAAWSIVPLLLLAVAGPELVARVRTDRVMAHHRQSLRTG